MGSPANNSIYIYILWLSLRDENRVGEDYRTGPRKSMSPRPPLRSIGVGIHSAIYNLKQQENMPAPASVADMRVQARVSAPWSSFLLFGVRGWRT